MTTIEKTNAIINGVVTTIDPNKEYTMTKDGLVETKDPLKEKWYRISEAAKEIRVSDQTVRNAITFGHLLATETPDSSAPGFHYMIKESDLIDWMDDKKKVRNQKKYDSYIARMREYRARNSKGKVLVTYEIPVDENGVKMIDANTVAERCGYKLTSIHNAISRNNLKATKHYVGGRSRWYISEADYKAWRENGSHDNHRGAKMKFDNTNIIGKVENVEEHKEGLSMVISVPTENFKSLKDINTEIQKLMDYCYKLGFEDGKVSVEHDISDEYNKGFAEGKKQAMKEFLSMQEELTAMVKGV